MEKGTKTVKMVGFRLNLDNAEERELYYKLYSGINPDIKKTIVTALTLYYQSKSMMDEFKVINEKLDELLKNKSSTAKMDSSGIDIEQMYEANPALKSMLEEEE